MNIVLDLTVHGSKRSSKSVSSLGFKGVLGVNIYSFGPITLLHSVVLFNLVELVRVLETNMNQNLFLETENITKI